MKINMSEIGKKWLEDLKKIQSKLKSNDKMFITGYFHVVTFFNPETEEADLVMTYKAYDYANLLGHISMGSGDLQNSLLNQYSIEEEPESLETEIFDPSEDLTPPDEGTTLH